MGYAAPRVTENRLFLTRFGPLDCSGGAAWPGSGMITGVPMLIPGAAHAGGKVTVTLI